MAWWECQSCKGVYEDQDSQGYAYYHVCPAEVNPDYQPNPRKQNYDPRESIPRKNHRDENHNGGRLDGRPMIKAEGMGRIPFAIHKGRGVQ